MELYNYNKEQSQLQGDLNTLKEKLVSELQPPFIEVISNARLVLFFDNLGVSIYGLVPTSNTFDISMATKEGEFSFDEVSPEEIVVLINKARNGQLSNEDEEVTDADVKEVLSQLDGTQSVNEAFGRMMVLAGIKGQSIIPVAKGEYVRGGKLDEYLPPRFRDEHPELLSQIQHSHPNDKVKQIQHAWDVYGKMAGDMNEGLWDDIKGEFKAPTFKKWAKGDKTPTDHFADARRAWEDLKDLPKHIKQVFDNAKGKEEPPTREETQIHHDILTKLKKDSPHEWTTHHEKMLRLQKQALDAHDKRTHLNKQQANAAWKRDHLHTNDPKTINDVPYPEAEDKPTESGPTNEPLKEALEGFDAEDNELHQNYDRMDDEGRKKALRRILDKYKSNPAKVLKWVSDKKVGTAHHDIAQSHNDPKAAKVEKPTPKTWDDVKYDAPEDLSEANPERDQTGRKKDLSRLTNPFGEDPRGTLENNRDARGRQHNDGVRGLRREGIILDADAIVESFKQIFSI
jgi:hypothetical protein